MPQQSAECDEQSHMVDLVVRQTGYTPEEAESALQANNNDVLATIRSYMLSDNTAPVTSSRDTSLNQKIYGEIRSLLDDAGAEYRRKKEAEERQAAQIEAIRKTVARVRRQTGIARAFGQPEGVAPTYSGPSGVCTQPLFTVTDSQEGLSALDLLRVDTAIDDHALGVALSAVAASARGVFFASDQDDCTDAERASALVREARKRLGTEAIVAYQCCPEGPCQDIETIGEDAGLSQSEARRASYADNNAVRVCCDARFDEHLQLLRQVQDAGADFLVTAPFYDIGVFFDFLTAVDGADIKLPVAAGTEPILGFEQYNSLLNRRRVRVPQGIQATMRQLDGDGQKCAAYGRRLAVSSAKALMLRGVRHWHSHTTAWEPVVTALGLSQRRSRSSVPNDTDRAAAPEGQVPED